MDDMSKILKDQESNKCYHFYHKECKQKNVLKSALYVKME